MGSQRPKLITIIQKLIIISIFSLSALVLLFQVITRRSYYKSQSETIQKEYHLQQKEIIQEEVDRVVDLIENNLDDLEKRIEVQTKGRSSEALAVVENIYKENHGHRSEVEIKKMILDALRPVKFHDNVGYFFITTLNGDVVLLDDRPELEGQNLIDFKDLNGDYIFRNLTNIINKTDEGLSHYLWSKPGEEGTYYEKISYVKLFEPYGWIVGTGIYVDDVLFNEKRELLRQISNISYGGTGYIHVTTYEGDVIVSNGNVFDGNLKLWDQKISDEEDVKEIFNKQYKAAINPEGDFLYYSVSNHPKVTYVYGMSELNWIISTGVYLNVIEKEIEKLQELSYREMVVYIRNTVIITLLIALAILVIFLLLSRNLKTDFVLFMDFFDNAVTKDVAIDKSSVKYRELYLLADRANNMQKEKFAAELKLRDSEAKFRLISENSKDMVFKINILDGSYDYISPASLDITGYTPEEIQLFDSFIRDIIHPDWIDWLDGKIRDISNGFVDDTVEYQIIHKSGNVVWINQKNKMIKDCNGNTTAIVGRLSDDTERKSIEDQLRHSYRLDAIGQIAGGVAHDFNNIIGGIMNASQVLSSPKREMDEKGKLMVELIRKSAKRAADLTGKLSSFSRKRTINLQLLDVHPLIIDTVEVLKESLSKDIDVSIKNSAVNPIALADAAEFQSAVLNLIINASHAIEGVGTITIETKNRVLEESECNTLEFKLNPVEYVQIEVRDTGSGIEPELLDKVFEPFFSTKGKGKGTGLGLATVYGAVLDHHGAIYVNSEIGQGTSFFILIPSSQKFMASPVIQNGILKKGKGTILVVDDEEIIRITSKNILEDMGFTIITAVDGEDAVNIYKEQGDSIDLIIMDMIMPKMNGRIAFHKLRELNSECKIVIVSGYAKDEDIEHLRQSGMSGFLRKPFTVEHLNKVVTDLLN